MARDQATLAEPDVHAPNGAPEAPARPSRARRIRLFAILAVAVAAAALIWFLYWLLIGSHHVETDDAYVQASNAQVTALVSGQLVRVPIYETQAVKAGQVLAEIDPADFRLAVARA